MEQKVVDYIKEVTGRRISWLDRSQDPRSSLTKGLLQDIQKSLLETQTLDDALLNRIKADSSYELRETLSEVLSYRLKIESGSYPWDITSPLIKKIVHHDNIKQPPTALTPHASRYIFEQLTRNPDLDLNMFLEFLKKQKFTDEDIVTICVSARAPFYVNDGESGRTSEDASSRQHLTKFSEFLLPLLNPTKGLLGFSRNSGVKELVDDIVLSTSSHDGTKLQWLQFLFEYFPDKIERVNKFLLIRDYNDVKKFDVSAALLVASRDAKRFENDILRALEEYKIDNAKKFAVLLTLSEKIPGAYDEKINKVGEDHLAYFQTSYEGSYFYEPSVLSKPMAQAYLDRLIKQDETTGKERVRRFIEESRFLNPAILPYIEEVFGKSSLPLLQEALKKNPEDFPKSSGVDFYVKLFETIDTHDFSSAIDSLFDFALAAGKKYRELACKSISRYAGTAVKRACELLTEKTVDQRVTGALILFYAATPESEAALNEAVDTESNDDTRDIMLEALASTRFKVGYTEEQAREMIAKAAGRKKLSKWNEKWIDESAMPALYWKNSKKRFTTEEVRFLFYRMKRAKGLNSDIEARQVVSLIDRERTNDFAKMLLVAFENSNADNKLKYYLTLAALLGGDDMMHNLNSLFRKNIADKRIKMAENVVGALAMVGTDKALRLVEVIYRKFATKRPSVSAAAKHALDAAAAELGITMDELADRIIPDFDFEGLYKHVSIEGENYRAFINSEFKINFFTDDNKLRKSLPANAPKELKAEFKEIEKELNEVAKTQSGRLEKYMIEERRWPTQSWRKFFFENPIMFVYGLKLLWGVFDKAGELVNSFYCSEDTSFYDVNDDEVALPEDEFIGILHPVYLTPDALSAWKDKLYNLGLTTVFPIIDRKVFRPEESELALNFTKQFFNVSVPKGADFCNTFLVKLNWIKITSDGGRCEFHKPFKDGVILADANIDGPTAWYQGGTEPAKVYEISFRGKGWNDKRSLKDVPAVFYSEVLADIHQLVNAK